jgi:capsular polysaccharide biosynthesis protein
VKSRWRVVALSILVGGIAGFAWAALMPDVYVAETAVIATQSPVTADQIGPIAETAFSTDPVLQPVIDRLDLQGTPASLISTGALEARSQADGPALLITGRASDPILAADLANAATEAFVTVAEQKGLGTFAPFESVGPGVLQPHHTSLLILLGMLAGAGVGFLVLVVVFFLRDPIVSEDDARKIFSPDVAFRLQVSARRAPAAGGDARPQENAEFDESSNVVLSMLSEAVRDHAERDGRGASAVIVDGGDSVWAAAAVARELEARAGDSIARREPPDRFSISSSDPRLSEILEARDAVVAIVPSGAPRRSLQRLDEEVHSLGGRFRVLVLVDPRR